MNNSNEMSYQGPDRRATDKEVRETIISLNAKVKVLDDLFSSFRGEYSSQIEGVKQELLNEIISFKKELESLTIQLGLNIASVQKDVKHLENRGATAVKTMHAKNIQDHTILDRKLLSLRKDFGERLLLNEKADLAFREEARTELKATNDRIKKVDEKVDKHINEPDAQIVQTWKDIRGKIFWSVFTFFITIGGLGMWNFVQWLIQESAKKIPGGG